MFGNGYNKPKRGSNEEFKRNSLEFRKEFDMGQAPREPLVLAMRAREMY